MKKNKIEIEKRVDNKIITKRKHPTEELFIYNYSQKCQFDRLWDRYTMMCRGLIMDNEGNIVARPFKKFFNYGEIEDQKLPNGNFRVYDKMDGSLGICFYYNSKWLIATRGSFESEQAIKSNELLMKYDTSQLDKKKTYLFEIIYPENRIVIDYRKTEDIFLLAVIDTKTGSEEDIYNYRSEFKLVKEIKGVDDFTKLTSVPKDNLEGFVIVWEDGFRIKMKFEEYVRLHRLITGINERKIWDILRNEESIDELLERVPDEFYKWTKDIKEKLEKRFCNLRDEAKVIKREAEKLSTRKEQALFIFKQKNGKKLSGVVFNMLDNKDWKSGIWKIIKPKIEKSFKVIT